MFNHKLLHSYKAECQQCGWEMYISPNDSLPNPYDHKNALDHARETGHEVKISILTESVVWFDQK